MEPDKCHMCGGDVMEDGRCSRCMAIVSYGRGSKKKELRVVGTVHSEVSKVIRELQKEHRDHPILYLITHWSFWFGSLLSILGGVLVVVGATGETEFTFFGQSFRSQNIGIASFFLGAALVILNVRRLLASYDKSQKKNA